MEPLHHPCRFLQGCTLALGLYAWLLVPHVGTVSVSDASVRVEFNSPSFIISWMAPFTLTVPLAPPTSYCVSITNTSTGSSQQLTNECGILMTQYSVDLEYDPCVEYSVSIIAVNPVGNGTAAVIPFPGMLVGTYTLTLPSFLNT